MEERGRSATGAVRWQIVAARLAWPLLLVVLSLWFASRIMAPPPPGLEYLDPAPWHLAMAAYGVIGCIILTRRPDNLVGWLFLVVGVFDPLSAAVRAVAIADPGGAREGAALVATWLQAWIWAPSLASLALLTWVFPTGRPLAGRWRWGVVVVLGSTAILLVAAPIALWPLRGRELLLDEAVPGIAGLLTTAGFAGVMLGAAGGVVSLVVRFRRSRSEERLQLKWFVWAAILVAIQAFTDIVILDGLGVGDSMWREGLSAAALTVLPAAAGVALLKYRLYDIDRLINRTVVYGALTAACAVMYLTVVALARLLTQPLTGDTNLAVAVSTLAVAALFRPARRRVQDAVDRRFNRARYDAVHTVREFSHRLRDQVDLETLHVELLTVVDTTVQPARSSLWLKGQGA
jgi:hypothetical protein